MSKQKLAPVVLSSRTRESFNPHEKNPKKVYPNRKEKLTFSNDDKVLIHFMKGKPTQIATISDGILHDSGDFLPNKHNIYLEKNLKVGASVNVKLLKLDEDESK